MLRDYMGSLASSNISFNCSNEPVYQSVRIIHHSWCKFNISSNQMIKWPAILSCSFIKFKLFSGEQCSVQTNLRWSPGHGANRLNPLKPVHLFVSVRCFNGNLLLWVLLRHTASRWKVDRCDFHRTKKKTQNISTFIGQCARGLSHLNTWLFLRWLIGL